MAAALLGHARGRVQVTSAGSQPARRPRKPRAGGACARQRRSSKAGTAARWPISATPPPTLLVPFRELEFPAACSCEQHVDAAVGLPRLEQRRSERRGGVGRIWTAERGLERSGLSPPDGALSAEVLRD